jgi:hypothetical protein
MNGIGHNMSTGDVARPDIGDECRGPNAPGGATAPYARHVHSRK